MKKILIIKTIASFGETSNTNNLLETFIAAYKEANPNDKIEIIDTYDINAQPLTQSDLQTLSAPDNEIIKYAKQVLEYDKIVFAAPMWNLSIPASLKCYIDYITYAGVTFEYTENGPVGLLNNPKILHITSRGGFYDTEPTKSFEMGDRYLRTLMQFLGSSDFTTFSLDGTNSVPVEVVAENKAKLSQELIDFAKNF
ncbi:MAG: FMN-dependent NADH-azoreductase [Mycoplasmatales bacterium]